jgi:hypothetical protein
LSYARLIAAEFAPPARVRAARPEPRLVATQAAESTELLKAEGERADKAIPSFASLAERLDTLATEVV